MPNQIVVGLMSGMFGMLVIASLVINATLGRPQECLVKYSHKDYTVVMVGKYELNKFTSEYSKEQYDVQR